MMKNPVDLLDEYRNKVVKKIYTDQYNNIMRIEFYDNTALWKDLMQNCWYFEVDTPDDGHSSSGVDSDKSR